MDDGPEAWGRLADGLLLAGLFVAMWGMGFWAGVCWARWRATRAICRERRLMTGMAGRDRRSHTGGRRDPTRYPRPWPGESGRN